MRAATLKGEFYYHFEYKKSHLQCQGRVCNKHLGQIFNAAYFGAARIENTVIFIKLTVLTQNLGSH